MDETTQQLIDGLITFIWHTEERSSVTNLMVARVLDWLNRKAVEIREEMDRGIMEHAQELVSIERQISNIVEAMKGVNTLAGSAFDTSQNNSANIGALARYINGIIQFLETGNAPEGWKGEYIEGVPGRDASVSGIVTTPNQIVRHWDTVTEKTVQTSVKIEISVFHCVGSHTVRINTLYEMISRGLSLWEEKDGAMMDITADITESGTWARPVGVRTQVLRYSLVKTEQNADDALISTAEIAIHNLNIPVQEENSFRMVDPYGNTVTDYDLAGQRAVDRGEWQEGEEYYAGDRNPATGVYEISYVWYMGCKYRCLKTGTADPPLWNSPDWQFAEGDPELHLDINLGSDSYIARGEVKNVECGVRIYNQDATDAVTAWKITRETGDDTEDTAWNLGTKAKEFAGKIDVEWSQACDDIGTADKALFRITAKIGEDTITETFEI